MLSPRNSQPCSASNLGPTQHEAPLIQEQPMGQQEQRHAALSALPHCHCDSSDRVATQAPVEDGRGVAAAADSDTFSSSGLPDISRTEPPAQPPELSNLGYPSGLPEMSSPNHSSGLPDVSSPTRFSGPPDVLSSEPSSGPLDGPSSDCRSASASRSWHLWDLFAADQDVLVLVLVCLGPKARALLACTCATGLAASYHPFFLRNICFASCQKITEIDLRNAVYCPSSLLPAPLPPRCPDTSAVDTPMP
ncbi:hypothetical protein CYMTET_43423 [Cymbomonas tetramitiformis]|uniref:Uncharacterized protein n=1 Tax=Cymbomonas tetramitiformis TaxID=36881 RepID=A0AAE0EZZ7_9CHLO|nr:hypothetical protein CYMTET_43423 [Cymbomonas tetramitiformis]